MKFFISLTVIIPFGEHALTDAGGKRRSKNKVDLSYDFLLLRNNHGSYYFLFFVC